jgi:hypothetical protein
MISAGGDNVDTVTVVVGEGRAKVVSAVPVGIPREAVVGTVKRQTDLAGGMKWVGGKVIGEAVKTRPGREGRIRAPRTHDIQGEFDMGKEAVPEVIREVRVGGCESGDEVVFARPH